MRWKEIIKRFKDKWVLIDVKKAICIIKRTNFRTYNYLKEAKMKAKMLHPSWTGLKKAESISDFDTKERRSLLETPFF